MSDSGQFRAILFMPELQCFMRNIKFKCKFVNLITWCKADNGINSQEINLSEVVSVLKEQYRHDQHMAWNRSASFRLTQ